MISIKKSDADPVRTKLPDPELLRRIACSDWETNFMQIQMRYKRLAFVTLSPARIHSCPAWASLTSIRYIDSMIINNTFNDRSRDTRQTSATLTSSSSVFWVYFYECWWDDEIRAENLDLVIVFCVSLLFIVWRLYTLLCCIFSSFYLIWFLRFRFCSSVVLRRETKNNNNNREIAVLCCVMSCVFMTTFKIKQKSRASWIKI